MSTERDENTQAETGAQTSRVGVDADVITRRDYFAAMAMQGLLANSFADGVNQPLSTATPAEIAAMARDQADHLINELDTKKGERK